MFIFCFMEAYLIHPIDWYFSSALNTTDIYFISCPIHLTLTFAYRNNSEEGVGHTVSLHFI